MNNKVKNAVSMFNVIRTNATEAFMQRIPSATSDNISTLKGLLFDENYQPYLNEFVDSLINRIALTIVRNKSFNNPLAMFKKGTMPLGTDVQEIYTNPAVAEQYEYSNTAMAKLLTITDPDTKVAYYRRNRKDLYTKTISREGLQGAFNSWENFNDFVASITNSLYSGNYIDEFKYTKELIGSAYLNNKVVVETIDNVVTGDNGASAQNLLIKLRALYMNMKFPSSNYNAYNKLNPNATTPIVTWTDDDRIVILIRTDVLSIVDVTELARAFNMEKADFIGRVIPVDNFGEGADNVKACICDESFLQIYDNIFRFDEFYNARVMVWNEYLHAWGTWAISPFANAVVLATENPVSVETITISDAPIELDLSSIPSEEGLEITLNPANATTPIEYSSSNPAVFRVVKNANNNITLYPVTQGTATLTAEASNGVKATNEVNVTKTA